MEKRIHKALFALFICSVGAIYYIKRAEFVKDIVNRFVVDHIITLNDLIYEGATTYFDQYKIILILGIPIITILILWTTFKFFKNFILIVSLGAVIALWFSRSYAVVKENLFVYVFISLLTFIITSYIKKIQQYKNQGVKVYLKFTYILVYGVIISLIISKIILMLPQEYKGRDLSSYGNYFENKFASDNSGIDWAKENMYSLSSSGYSDNDKRLGGPISLDSKEVFKVKSDKPYYLKGNVKDFYDGNKWTKTNENYFKKLSGADMGFLNYKNNGIGKKNSLIIYPDKKFKTNTIFVPNYTFDISGVEGTLFYDKTPTVLSENIVTKSYNVDFYEYPENIDTIEDVREYSKKILERANNLATSFVPDGPMNYFLQPKPKNINMATNNNSSIMLRFSFKNGSDSKLLIENSKYFQVPENISDRTYDLVKDIIKNCNTSIEKVLAIKNYLTKNYVYDIQVSAIPKDSEFIDYFLFQEKKGYCTYFNTAMTVMCRIAGVPARYVEGFKTPDNKDDSGLYSVSSSDAHAWCEVLLGAFQYSNMWTIVDASPTASEDMQRKLKELKDQQKNSVDSGDSNISINNTPQNKASDVESAGGEGTSKVIALSNMQLRIINILTVVILFILMRVIKVMKRRSKLLRSKGVVPLYNYYFYRLETVYMVKPEYQGDMEFVQDLIDLKLKERMQILVHGAYEEYYGKHSVVGLDNKECYDFLEEYLKEYQGTFEYLLNKYLGEIK
nr:transglutaminase domain-containing protein [Clostridium sp.]